MTNEELWNKFVSIAKTKYTSMSLNYIFKNLKLYSYNNSIITLKLLKDGTFLQNIKSNYENTFQEIFNEITNDTCEIKYIYDTDEIENEKDINNTKIIENKNNEELDNITNYKYMSNFNPNYTFDTFIVGDSNRLAYGTALSVAKNPGKLYNPYFIYAKSGLGKTHLLHAIGNYIVTHSDKKVLYITAEQFTDDYRSIVTTKNNSENMTYLQAFRNKYRNVDVLIIDDIQFLESKYKTQIEFTNTFNTLRENEKQIIIASDTSIDDYKYLEDRLKTRFRWGLTESINPPEIELKKDIIRSKIIYYNLDINEEIIDYIARNCGNNMRNVENAIIRIVAYKATMNISDVNLEIVQNVLQEYIPKAVYRTNSVSKIINVVSKYYNLDSSMLKGKMKKKNITDARSIAMYLSRLMTDESLERIGLEFGGRDHSTVIHSCDKITKELLDNSKLQEEINILKDKICEQ